jgi:PTH1 family peptidyl-tRNA hydrolase
MISLVVVMSLSIQSQFSFDNIKLVVGLGNPGQKFKSTRHNAGFLFVDRLASKLNLSLSENSKFNSLVVTHKIERNKVILSKPLTFMNKSGKAVQNICTFYKIKPENILVAHDDLDIQLSHSKLQFARGPKIHNGIKSINEILGTDKYWRLRLGVDNRKTQAEKNIPGRKYVLQKMDTNTKLKLTENLNEIVTKFLNSPKI